MRAVEKLALSVPEAAEALGCSTWRIRRAVDSGDLPVLPAAIAGRRVLIPAAALERLVDDRATFRNHDDRRAEFGAA